MTSIAKNIILKLLQRLQYGQIHLIDKQDCFTFGTYESSPVTLTVKDHSFYSKILKHGSLGAAQSYIDGDWSVDNLKLISKEKPVKLVYGNIPVALIVFLNG